MDQTLVHTRVQVSQVEGQQADGEEAQEEGEEGPAEVGDEVSTGADTHGMLQSLSLNVRTFLGLHHHQPPDLLKADGLEQLQHEGLVHHDEGGGDDEQDEGIVEDHGGELGLVGAIFLDKVRLETWVLQRGVLAQRLLNTQMSSVLSVRVESGAISQSHNITLSHMLRQVQLGDIL